MADTSSQPKCGSCGHFIAYDDCSRSRFEFTPLNEFSPEWSEWTCPTCLASERQRRALHG